MNADSAADFPAEARKVAEAEELRAIEAEQENDWRNAEWQARDQASTKLIGDK